jgi:HK97 family phage major capsid protein
MEFLEVLRAKLATRIAERQAAKAELDAVLAAPTAEGRDLNDAESVAFTEARGKVTTADADITTIEGRVAELEAIEARNREVSANTPSSIGAGAARIKSEARTYNQHNDPKGKNFLRDVAARHLGNWDAIERLGRHQQEERVERAANWSDIEQRAAGTAAFAGLVVPQYLTDLVAKAASNARPFADICNIHDLPETGMTVNISRITTATSAASVAENTAVSETNIDDTLLTETIFQVSGQQTLSRLAIDRGTGTEEITLDDLARRYASALDSKLINDATTGLTNVAQNVAYTDASPTAAELYPKVLNAQSNLEAVMADQGVGDLYAIMHSRRWAWMQSQVGTSWPFLSQPGYDPRAGGANYATGYGQGVRGVLPNGIKVICDNNIGTTLGAGTEDEIYIVNAAECHLWEDPSAPMFIRAEQPAAASLGVLLVVYGYAAYSFRRYTNGMQKISGTGLIAPSF